MKTPVKVLLSLEADKAVIEMKNETNAGFLDGQVTKNEMLSWIVLEFQKSHFKKCLSKIRDDHFDEVIHLQSRIEKIKAARKNGVPVESSVKTTKNEQEEKDQPRTTKKLGNHVEDETA